LQRGTEIFTPQVAGRDGMQGSGCISVARSDGGARKGRTSAWLVAKNLKLESDIQKFAHQLMSALFCRSKLASGAETRVIGYGESEQLDVEPRTTLCV
jgi:hypothetical protein